MESEDSSHAVADVEAVLRDELAQGDAMLGTVGPILRHLLDSGGNSFFGDDIVASVRAMANDIAGQLLDELAEAGGAAELREHEPGDLTALTAAIVASPALLGHLHALAMEWQATERLQRRLALDSVLPPLLQAMIASSDAEMSSLAMSLLASQARFCQAQRRMRHSIMELPGDLFHGVLVAMRTLAGFESEADARAAAAEAAIRARYDESRGRLGQIARLVAGLGGDASAALSITHAGVAMFLSVLALASGQDRDLATLSLHESQLGRLALAMRAAGLKQEPVEQQFLALHPEIALPEGFDRMGPDRAAALLALGNTAWN